MEYSCFIYSEGRRDKNFLIVLIDLPKFKYHTRNWFFTLDSASGESPETILSQCQKSSIGVNYHLILCFIDRDRLKKDYGKKWEIEKKKLEKKYSNIVIIWQIDNLEDEHKKVLGEQYSSKHKSNKIAKKRVAEFINSDFWKRILRPIKDKEQELKQ